MADVHPFVGLRYSPQAGPLDSLVAPPYDVISPERQASLYALSPHNAIRLEYGTTRPSDDDTHNRYSRAAADFHAWIESGVLAPEAGAAFYVYRQGFEYAGNQYQRTAVIAAVRLEPWDIGVIRPHEFTMANPKADRLKLIESVRANTSPVFGLIRDDDRGLRDFIAQSTAAEPAVTAKDDIGHEHLLWVVTDPHACAGLTAALELESIYIADGHHRYETALAYRDTHREIAPDHPANFVMLALVAVDDPGLVVRPIHRLVNPANDGTSLVSGMTRCWEVNGSVAAGGRDPLHTLLAQVQAEGRYNTAFGMIRKSGLSRVSLRHPDLVEEGMPEDAAPEWRSLDVNRLQYGILQPLLDIGQEQLTSGKYVSFTEDAETAQQAVTEGQCQVAFLVNPTPVEQILEVADAGGRMPQKSTFFYPKLGTGLVMRKLT